MGTYKRVLLKLSGESLGGPAGKGIDENWLAAYAEEVAEAVKNGLQVSIVIGGGNIFRGLQGVGKGFDRVNGDKMGMLATVINSLGLAMAIRSAGVEAEVEKKLRKKKPKLQVKKSKRKQVVSPKQMIVTINY